MTLGQWVILPDFSNEHISFIFKGSNVLRTQRCRVIYQKNEFLRYGRVPMDALMGLRNRNK